MLHIRCGDDILYKLKEVNFPGKYMKWADPLCQGPTPSGLTREQWRATRAKFASDFYNITLDYALNCLSQQDENLKEFLNHKEVILWFEHGLFDQIILIYLLNWFSQQALGKTKIELIYSGKHLGNMNSKNLKILFEKKHPVTPQEFELAQKTWKAFCSSNPSKIQSITKQDSSSLPYLKGALIRHLQQFPSKQNGLNLTERFSLEVISMGEYQPFRIFEAVQKKEENPWLGITMFWPYLQHLATGDEPLLSIRGDGQWRSLGKPHSKLTVQMTQKGREILSGRSDNIKENGIARWLGGVHLFGDEAEWRWDSSTQTLVH
ncbi:MAG TPA: hypothetical protein VGB26_03770 [Nitrospiria bacterium]|jgi:hypothetical protein